MLRFFGTRRSLKCTHSGHQAAASKLVVPAYGLTSRCEQNSLLLPSAGCIHRHDRKRTSAADCGLSIAAGSDVTSLAGTAVGSLESGGALLLKLDSNRFLQRAQRALFFGCDERQRATR